MYVVSGLSRSEPIREGREECGNGPLCSLLEPPAVRGWLGDGQIVDAEIRGLFRLFHEIGFIKTDLLGISSTVDML